MASTAVALQLQQQLPLEVSLAVTLAQQLLQQLPLLLVDHQQLLLQVAASCWTSLLLLDEIQPEDTLHRLAVSWWFQENNLLDWSMFVFC